MSFQLILKIIMKVENFQLPDTTDDKVMVQCTTVFESDKIQTEGGVEINFSNHCVEHSIGQIYCTLTGDNTQK